MSGWSLVRQHRDTSVRSRWDPSEWGCTQPPSWRPSTFQANRGRSLIHSRPSLRLASAIDRGCRTLPPCSSQTASALLKPDVAPRNDFAPIATHPSHFPLFRFRNILHLNSLQPIDRHGYLPSQLHSGCSHAVAPCILSLRPCR